MKIQLTESQLHRVIKESVAKILKEYKLKNYEIDNEIGCDSENCKCGNGKCQPKKMKLDKFEDGKKKMKTIKR